MSKIDRQRRPRRIAADEAHAWARNLRLGNHHGKSVLKALSLYVDGDGWCFVGVEQLAHDCELSADTVRRRLVWLEEIGAVLRRPQWINSRGCRNSDGEGKRTSDLIRMMVDAGNDHLIEARARGEVIDEDDSDDDVMEQINPGSQQGLSRGAETPSPAPALGQPSHCGEGLISEPEPELSPLPPSRGRECGASEQKVEEPEDFVAAWRCWRGHEVMGHRRQRALEAFKKLSTEHQRLCRAAIAPYNAALDRHNRTRTAVNFDLWIKRGGFLEFPDAKLVQIKPVPDRRWVSGAELGGLEVAGRIAERKVRSSLDPERGVGFWTTMLPRPDISALAKFRDAQADSWIEIDDNTPEFEAWRDCLQRWLGVDEIKTQRVFTEPYDAAVHGLPAIHPNFRIRKFKQVLRVPTLWPPQKDGTIYLIHGDGNIDHRENRETAEGGQPGCASQGLATSLP